MDQATTGQTATKSTTPRPTIPNYAIDRDYIPTITKHEFVRILEKRALAMGKKTSNSLSLLDSAICVYLISYLVDQEPQTTGRFSANLTGILARALDDLASPRTTAAKRFIERYNQIGGQTYDDWKNVPSIRLTHVDGPDYQLNIIYVIKTLIHEIFGDYEPVDFAVLESERKVLLLHFQRFMKKIWQKANANEKELRHNGKTLSGVFGHTRFTTYHLSDYIVFKFSDTKDDFYAIQLVMPTTTREGYKARIAECKVDLISALRMIEDVSKHFKLENYRPIDQPESSSS